ncbi:origin recognition complex subunit 6-domain-containing protein [Phaeosphaeriaceae sp. PMI808]|nr:origin recognition complex subunit 6-domain-containing protein [Phaeosphaeriaceae sp. PMI808]
MSRLNVEQALTGLIPALNGPLPPELVDLTLSLLARSRSVAHSLKPDEEIARPYACAQLACERSKKRFNLPTIVSRPPCPPRVYKKLYNYLSSVLPAHEATREPQTPSKKATSASASTRTTPKTPRSTKKPNGTTAEVPEWVMPVIRSLLKTFDFPSAAPHIFTGVESILPLLERMAAAGAVQTPSKRPQRTATPQGAFVNVTNARILGLTSIVFLYVFTKMKNVDVTPKQYKEWRETAVNSILELPVGQEINYEELSLEIEELLPMAQAEGWLQMEWFTNVLPQEDAEVMEGVEYTDSSGRPVEGEGIATKANGSDYIGLGTMMQDATDYLGERQRNDYKSWKDNILSRIEKIEAR